MRIQGQIGCYVWLLGQNVFVAQGIENDIQPLVAENLTLN